MGEATGTSSRRSLLGRAAVLAAGAVGIGAGGASAAATPTSFTLYGSGLHLHSPSRKPGQVPAKGERFTSYAELSSVPGGAAVGHFTGSYVALDSPFAGALASQEVHTFALRDGTLLGLGTAGFEEGEFAIVGGTGRYRGAHGWYVARRRPRELGGDGTAEFNVTLEA
jgi:hypothetical protein